MIHLQADCSRCQGLCCVAPAFDAAQGFGHDKPAHQACCHLQADFRCGIHDRLREAGYPACAAYDCHGAGPQLTAHLAEQPAWSQRADAAAVFDAFLAQRRLHEQLLLLRLALPRAAALGPALQRLLVRVEAAAEACDGGAAAVLEAESRALLRGLRARLVPPSPPGR